MFYNKHNIQQREWFESNGWMETHFTRCKRFHYYLSCQDMVKTISHHHCNCDLVWKYQRLSDTIHACMDACVRACNQITIFAICYLLYNHHTYVHTHTHILVHDRYQYDICIVYRVKRCNLQLSWTIAASSKKAFPHALLGGSLSFLSLYVPI